MDATEKIRKFDSFDALTQEILRDKETRDMLAQRYAVRFIMLNNFDTFRNLAKFMAASGVAALDLEDMIDDAGNDGWITKDMLMGRIRSCEAPSFVTPFSEVVRFYSDEDFRGFFNDIMLLEDTRRPDKRIYIPLIGLQNRFTDFLNHFARIRESAPIWRFDANPQAVDVFLAKDKDIVLPKDSDQCRLNSLRDWLRFWKAQAPQNRVVCTSKPIAAKYRYSKPDNIFNFTRISNAYDFMTQFLNLSFPFEYREEDRRYWEQLLERIDKARTDSFSFDGFVRSLFNRMKFEASDIVGEWCHERNGSFERWLLKNYVLHTKVKDDSPYFAACMESTDDLSDADRLIETIVKTVFYETPENRHDAYGRERLALINGNRRLFEDAVDDEDQEWLYNRAKEIARDREDLSHAVALCSGVFDFERKLLMEWQAAHPQDDMLKKAIETCYPEYSAYRQNKRPTEFQPAGQQWLADYLEHYKEAKSRDEYTPEIRRTIETHNASSSSFFDWYFKFRSSHDLLAELDNDTALAPDKVYWIDGLGAEFFSYILYLVERENSDMRVVRSQFCRSELPTSTFHNRFDGEKVKKFGELDALGHDAKGYRHFDTLIEELKVIKDIVHEIVGASKNQKCTVAIVSDHGLSFLSRLEPSKKYDGKFEHEGRYIKTDDTARPDSDYIVHKNADDGHSYKIALTHASLSKRPTHQVHGGCTPEEVVVPFFVLSNKNSTNTVKYRIKLSSEDIMMSAPIVSATIIPEPKSATLTCGEKVYDMVRQGTSWTASLDGIPEGTHAVEIRPEGGDSFETTVRIIGMGSPTDIGKYFNL